MSTKYVVLSKQPIPTNDNVTATSQVREGETHWKSEKMVDAPTAKAAVAQVVKDLGAENGSYVAVPVRSWKPIKVKAEQKTTITFS